MLAYEYIEATPRCVSKCSPNPETYNVNERRNKKKEMDEQ